MPFAKKKMASFMVSSGEKLKFFREFFDKQWNSGGSLGVLSVSIVDILFICI
jgi:hypothetical protein